MGVLLVGAHPSKRSSKSWPRAKRGKKAQPATFYKPLPPPERKRSTPGGGA